MSLTSASAAPAQPGVEPATVTIGVLAHRGDRASTERWTPTVEYLGERVNDAAFRLEPLTLEEMDRALARERLDFILTNPGNYVELEGRYGISRIATLKNMRQGRSYKVFGAVIFTAASRADIRTLGDLENRTFGAVAPEAFGGFQMAWRELRERGLDPFEDLAGLQFMGFPQDAIVEKVLSGEVAAGTVRTNVLETMAERGAIDPSEVRVLNPRTSEGFPFRHSTRLYPEWAFAKSRHTSDDLAKRVTIALLALSGDDPAARAGRYAGWTVPLNYQPVHELFKALEIGPYTRRGELTLAEAAEQYWYWFVIVGGVVVFTLFHLVRVERQVFARTRQLTDSNRALENEVAERKRMEQETQSLLQENRVLVQKSMAVQEDERRHLARELHDELGQCITAIQADAETIRNLAQGRDERLVASAGAVQELSSSIYQVVHSMIQRLRPSVLDDLGLVDALKEEIRQWQARYPGVNYSLSARHDVAHLDERTRISIYRIVQECLTNVAKHAHASNVSVALWSDTTRGSTAFHVRVSDDGIGMEWTPQGRGLGVIGIRERVEALNGRLDVRSEPGSGAQITITVPDSTAAQVTGVDVA